MRVLSVWLNMTWMSLTWVAKETWVTKRMLDAIDLMIVLFFLLLNYRL